MIETADTAVICLIYKLIDSIRNKKELPKQWEEQIISLQWGYLPTYKGR
jgi:hypothetical protein